MLQALHLINGQAILRRVTDPNGRVAQLLRQNPTPTEALLIEDVYLWSLSRRPTAKEIEIAQKHFASYGEQQRADAAQDLMWALLNSRDFLLVR